MIEVNSQTIYYFKGHSTSEMVIMVLIFGLIENQENKELN